MSRRKPSIRNVPPGELSGILTDIKRSLEFFDAEYLTREQLVAASVLKLVNGVVKPGDAFVVDGGASAPINYTTPPQATGVAVTSLSAAVFIEFDPITYQGHSHAEILRSETSDLASAVPIGQTPQSPYVDTVGVGSPAYWYWVRLVNGAGDPGAVHAQSGLQAQTSFSSQRLVQALTGPGNPFKVVATETTLADGSVVPAGTYTADAFIHNGTITNAKIANLAVDDAKIASLSVSKLVAGSIAVGQYAQSTGYVAGSSGWRINGDGSAEFSGVVVRGTIFASQGAIGGWTIGASYLQSTTYALGTSGTRFNADGTGQIGGVTIVADALQSTGFVAGSAGWRLRQDGSAEFNSGLFRGDVKASRFMTGGFTGFAWPASGQSGSYLGPEGLMIGNANDGRYLQVDAVGDIYAPGFNVVNGVMTINQANVVKSLNIADQAVSVTVSAVGWNSCGVWVTVPAGVTGRLALIAFKDASNQVSNFGTPGTAHGFHVRAAGNIRSLTTYKQSIYIPSGDSDIHNQYTPSATIVHAVNVGPGSYWCDTWADSMGNGANSIVTLVVIATWR